MDTKADPLFFELQAEEIPNDSARRFDMASSAEWNPQPEYNLHFLRAQQMYFNDVLHAKGNVFLNEVYDALGFPRTKLAAVVGWLSPGVVDFGLLSDEDSFGENFFDLNFNIQGVILDHL